MQGHCEMAALLSDLHKERAASSSCAQSFVRNLISAQNVECSMKIVAEILYTALSVENS